MQSHRLHVVHNTHSCTSTSNVLNLRRTERCRAMYKTLLKIVLQRYSHIAMKVNNGSFRSRMLNANSITTWTDNGSARARATEHMTSMFLADRIAVIVTVGLTGWSPTECCCTDTTRWTWTTTRNILAVA